MSLVGDYGSDSEQEEAAPALAPAPALSSSKPSSTSTSSGGTLFNPSAYRAMASSKFSGAKIGLRAGKEEEGEEEEGEEEEEERARKRKRLEESRPKAGGLTSLLPKPQNSRSSSSSSSSSFSSSSSAAAPSSPAFPSSAPSFSTPTPTPLPLSSSSSSSSSSTTTSFVPYSLQKREEAKKEEQRASGPAAPPKAPKNSFFTLDFKPKTLRDISDQTSGLEPIRPALTREVKEERTPGPSLPPPPPGPQLPPPSLGTHATAATPPAAQGEQWEDDQLRRFLPKKSREAGPIQIREVDPNAILQRKPGEHFDPNREGQFTSSFTKAGIKSKLNTKEKRKHQITWLANHAASIEKDLLEKNANGRLTKQQTQAKYGF